MTALRLKNIYGRLEQERLDGLLVSLPANITYLTGYPSRDSYLLASRQANIYFTDSRYAEESKKALTSLAETRVANGSVFNLIAKTTIELGLKRIGFEERYLAFAEYKKIAGYLGKNAELVPTHSLIEECRQIKDKEELKKIREAVRITGLTLKFARKLIKPGKTEIQIVGELERFIRYQGAEGPSFPIIVASGPNSSFPHHIPGSRKLRNNEPVLIDIGVDYLGYKSDLTRVIFLGKINALAQRIYRIVLDAQRKALEEVKSGMKLSDIDESGRKYIAKEGYGKFFGHNIGHGVGLEVHELPHVSAKDESFLKEGMVFTIEPAIYLPGKFGIRIEDMVLVKKGRGEVLSGSIDK